MAHHPDEFITIAEPVVPTTGFRCGSFMRRAAICAVSVFATVAIGGSVTAPRFSPATADCFPHQTTDQVEARVRAIQDLIALEAAVRARLSKTQPGIIVPPKLEIYR